MPATGRDIGPVVARLAEHDASRVVARLARVLGPARMELAEDAVQHALLQALRLWPRTGPPRQPAAWLFTVARNHVHDRLRREKRLTPLGDLLQDLPVPAPPETDLVHFARELSDDELALLFVACHSALPVESQIAFALKWVCGLSARQIASGLLTGEAAVLKRLQRARLTLADLNVRLEPPSAEDIRERIEAVRTTLFLFFNEGYSVSGGDKPCAPEICREAVRLAVALAGHEATAAPESDALAALLMLTFARLPGRTTENDDLLLLEEQDRALWDRRLIAAGLVHLARSARGEAISVWHLRAEIAAIHALAPDAGQIDWQRILDAYNRLCAIDGSPIAALGRAVAISRVDGPLAGLTALRPVLRTLPNNPYAQAAAGKLLLELDKPRAAARRFERAAEHARSQPERRLMGRYLQSANVG